VQAGGLNNILAIAAGNAFTVALQNVGLDSQVWAWGSNNNGQLGNGNINDSWSPVNVSGLSSTGAISVAAGYDHAVAMKTDGTVWAWGGNSNGQLGNGTTDGSVTPVQVSEMSGVAAVAAGEKDTVTLRIDGTVWAWGYNFYGQLGNNSTADSPIPVQAL
jgi:alpha-tubulin suppressor-like RCC1 family protein